MDVFDSLNVETFFGLDIAFVIDATGSMLSYINGAKESIKEIMNQSKHRFLKSNADLKMLKFGIVAYRDHPPQESSFITKRQDFSSFIEAMNFLDSLNASGGGDPPEAVLDGLHEAVFCLKWREESEKMIFLLLDNPGHGKRFGTLYDCPCGYNEKEILPIMKTQNIAFHVIRPKEENKKLDTMLDIFNQYINVHTLELEKHKKILVNSERIMDEKMEFRIFSRARLSSFRKSKDSVRSSPERKDKMNVSRERSRSRSRSPGKIRKDTLEISDLSKMRAMKKEYEFSAPEYVINDIEMNIENGIKDHISKVVIEKLNKYLKIDED